MMNEHLPNDISSSDEYMLHQDDNNDLLPHQQQKQGCTSNVVLIHHDQPRLSASTFRARINTLLENQVFQLFVIVLIAFNSIVVGIGTCEFVISSPKRTAFVESVDVGFLIIFTIEVALQFVAHGFGVFRHGWLAFDCAIVAICWIFLRYPLQVIRSFRLITHIQELKDLVRALLGVIPRMFAIFSLLLLVFYIFAVLFTQIFGDLYEDGITSEDYFSNLTTSAFTLTRLMTLDSWSVIVLEVMQVYSWSWIAFFTFIGISSFMAINLIVAVICDAVANLQSPEKMEEQEEISNLESKDTQQEQDQSRTMQVEEIQTKLNELTASLNWLVQQEQQRQTTQQGAS